MHPGFRVESYTVNLETERTFLNSIKMTNSDSVIRLHIENVKRIVILLVAIGFEVFLSQNF